MSVHTKMFQFSASFLFFLSRRSAKGQKFNDLRYRDCQKKLKMASDVGLHAPNDLHLKKVPHFTLTVCVPVLNVAPLSGQIHPDSLERETAHAICSLSTPKTVQIHDHRMRTLAPSLLRIRTGVSVDAQAPQVKIKATGRGASIHVNCVHRFFSGLSFLEVWCLSWFVQ